MERQVSESKPEQLKRRAAARLLRWGFSTTCVAEGTGLSRSAVTRIRRKVEQQTDDDLPVHTLTG